MLEKKHSSQVRLSEGKGSPQVRERYKQIDDVSENRIRKVEIVSNSNYLGFKVTREKKTYFIDEKTYLEIKLSIKTMNLSLSNWYIVKYFLLMYFIM